MNNSTQLTVNDLAAIKAIIDNACARGAFRANEMKSVGEIYDKLVSFLDAVVAQAEAATQTGSDSATEPNSEGEIK